MNLIQRLERNGFVSQLEIKKAAIPMRGIDKSELLVLLLSRCCCSNSDLVLVAGIRLEVDMVVEDDGNGRLDED